MIGATMKGVPRVPPQREVKYREKSLKASQGLPLTCHGRKNKWARAALEHGADLAGLCPAASKEGTRLYGMDALTRGPGASCRGQAAQRRCPSLEGSKPGWMGSHTALGWGQ